MKILIIAAMDKEINLLCSLLEKPETHITETGKVTAGEIAGKEIIVASCGIGKVNAAINTYKLILAYHPDLVINSGVAGGTGLPVGSVLIAESITYHDVWCGPGTKPGQADGCPAEFKPSDSTLKKIRDNIKENEVIYGLICSGDKFISTPEEVKAIKSDFPSVKGIDMESGAVAQVCYQTDTPFCIIRVISDTPGDEINNISQYQNFWKEAPEKNFSIIKKIITSL